MIGTKEQLDRDIKTTERNIESAKAELEKQMARLAALKEEQSIKSILLTPKNVREGSIDYYAGPNWALRFIAQGTEQAMSSGVRMTHTYPSIFLANCDGTWYNEQGEKVSGYFSFKPNK